MTQDTNTASVAADLRDTLINIAREIEALKRECGMDPESTIAIQNGRYMALSYKVRALAAAQATAAQQPGAEDAALLDFLIEQRAYVVSDPDTCPGYWLHFVHKETGKCLVQGDEHPTPREIPTGHALLACQLTLNAGDKRCEASD